MRTISFLVTATLLVACGSPPKPASVDPSAKRPVNSASAIALQVCEHDLFNTQLRLRESSWIEESVSASRAQVTALQQNIAALQSVLAPGQAGQSSNGTQTPPRDNRLYVFRFDSGSSRLDIPENIATALKQEAQRAPLIILRGRTDGQIETAAETAIAKARAFAARDFLVAAGIDPTHIRPTYQGVGDHVSENQSAAGRRMNRRVEIEIYRSLPATMATADGATEAGTDSSQ